MPGERSMLKKKKHWNYFIVQELKKFCSHFFFTCLGTTLMQVVSLLYRRTSWMCSTDSHLVLYKAIGCHLIINLSHCFIYLYCTTKEQGQIPMGVVVSHLCSYWSHDTIIFLCKLFRNIGPTDGGEVHSF